MASLRLQLVFLGLVALSCAQFARPSTDSKQQPAFHFSTVHHLSDHPDLQQDFHRRPAVPAPAPTHIPPFSGRLLKPQAAPAFGAAPKPHAKALPAVPAPPPPPPAFEATRSLQPTIGKAPAPVARALPAVRLDADGSRALKGKDDEALFRKQAESAHYAFDSNVEDGIMGHSHQRQEVRDGLRVEGKYSYSDGFFRRAVHYAADENGYRVLSEESEPIGNGPAVNIHGSAQVDTNVDGVNNHYVVSASDIPQLKV